jgi:UDP-N-acetylmuramate--alanine ligase
MRSRHIHLVGIGGIGLSAIARVLVARGVTVSGSDQTASAITDELAKLGVKIFIGHRAENIGDADLVLVTSAAPIENPEIIEARRRGIQVDKRYDFFSELTQDKKTIAIAGTHGKTTTTGMIAAILVSAGLDPDVIVGGIIPELGSNARAGQGDYFVVEADEYDRAFLGLRPTIAVVTNIELDHVDIYRDVNDVAQAFGEFMRLVPQDGLMVGCGDSETVVKELEDLGETPIAQYGFGEANEWRAVNVQPNDLGGNDFAVTHNQSLVTNYRLQIPGRHNVLNALAAIAIADYLKIDLNVIRATLAKFRGAARRFEIKGEFRGVTIIDDYAHHPTEIRATLAAARTRYANRQIWAVFQPHTYSRTKALLDEFAQSFHDADHVIITDVYAAREQDNLGVSAAQIVGKMNHRDARFIAPLDECAGFLSTHLKLGDILITLGAGDVNRVGARIAEMYD